MAASLRGRSSADKAQWEEYEFDDWIQGGSAVESVKLVGEKWLLLRCLIVRDNPTAATEIEWWPGPGNNQRR